jgi:O-antigen ligase
VGALLSYWPAVSTWLRPASMLLIGAVASAVGLLAWLDEDRRVRWIDGLTAGLLVISASALVVFALQYFAPIPAILDWMAGLLAFLRGEGAAAKFDSGNNWLIWGEGVTLRAVSPLVPSPNNLGGVIGLLLPFAAVRWLTAAPGRARAIAAVAVLLSITAVLVTYSRSTWVGIGVAGMGALAIVLAAHLYREPSWPPVRRLAMIVTMAVVALGIGYVGVVTAGHQEVEDRITRPFEDPSVTTRIDIDQKAVEAVVADPLRGAGLGNWSATIPSHGTRAYIHNVYLEYGAATGVFGLAWTLALVLVPIASGLRLARQRTAGSARLYGAALATAALFAAVQFLFEDNLLNPQYAWSQCLLLGMGAAAWRPRAA